MTEIAMVTNDGRRFTATSKEISAGDLSPKSEDISMGTDVEVSFALLTLPRIWVRAQVSWRKPDKTFGVRFDNKDERRQRMEDRRRSLPGELGAAPVAPPTCHPE